MAAQRSQAFRHTRLSHTLPGDRKGLLCVAGTLLAEPVSMGADAAEQDVGISWHLFLAWFDCPSRWISRGR